VKGKRDKNMPTLFFDAELGRLRESLTQMGGAVEKMLDMALTALQTDDANLAEAAIKADKEINEYDNKIVSKTILLIATNQPVAGDLRFLAASLRMAGELERIGDLSANLARRAKKLAEINSAADLPEDVEKMADIARSMLSGALDSFVTRNPDKAMAILARDDIVDGMNRQIRDDMVDRIARDGPLIYWGLEIINTAAHLERLSDHAANLAEEVIYIFSGHNIRHCEPSISPSPSITPAQELPPRENREDRED
jgi:phosphate transport system protein